MGAIFYKDKVYGAGGSGGGGSSAISELTDVDLDNLLDGQILKWNAATQKWENADESGVGSGYSETILFSGDFYTNAELQLDDDINNYDAIKIWFGWSGSSIGGKFPVIVSVDEFTTDFTYAASPGTATPHLFCFLYSSQYLRIARASDDTKLRVFDNHSGAIKKVVGIKY